MNISIQQQVGSKLRIQSNYSHWTQLMTSHRQTYNNAATGKKINITLDRKNRTRAQIKICQTIHFIQMRNGQCSLNPNLHILTDTNIHERTQFRIY